MSREQLIPVDQGASAGRLTHRVGFQPWGMTGEIAAFLFGADVRESCMVCVNGHPCFEMIEVERGRYAPRVFVAERKGRVARFISAQDILILGEKFAQVMQLGR